MPKFFILFIIISLQTFASVEADFNKANENFFEANRQSLENPQQADDLYQKAILQYEFIVKEKPTSAVFYNLGNCYFRTGDNGRAILNYQKARLLDPLNKDINHNLNYVRTMVADEFKESPLDKIISSIFVWSKLPINLQLTILIVTLSIFLTIKSRQLYGKSKGSNKIAYTAISIAALFLISSFITIHKLSENYDGVITAQEVVARQGDGLIYEPAFTGKLHNGTEFEILEDRDEWLHIVLPDDSKCWIQTNKTALF